MTIPDSRLPEQSHSTLERKHDTGLLSLNSLLQESLKKIQAREVNVKLIVRCETLPAVKADGRAMVELFDDLLDTIVSQSGDQSRLFLYIDCEEDTSDIIDMSVEEGLKRYFIKFHTNITTHDNWKLVNNETLLNCRQILSKHNGNLAVNDISSTGCLFSILLPGKIE